MLNKLDALELSADQKSKVEAAAKELNSTMMTLRKKGKDLEATVMASLNLSDDQQALLKKAAEAQTKFQKVVAETLTAEQLTALPQQLQQQLKRAKGEGKGPKKKKAA